MRKTGSILAVGFLLAVMPFAGKGTAAAQDDALPPILDEQGNPAPGSVVALQKINLGGVGQWILIRGRDETKPVLLVLHGGPGETMMPWVDLFQRRELEENFVVVHWDQRNAGKSYSSALSGEDLDVEAYVDDTLELADLLTRRFRQDRIFLAGVSWGSALGFLTLERNKRVCRLATQPDSGLPMGQGGGRIARRQGGAGGYRFDRAVRPDGSWRYRREKPVAEPLSRRRFPYRRALARLSRLRGERTEPLLFHDRGKELREQHRGIKAGRATTVSRLQSV